MSFTRFLLVGLFASLQLLAAPPVSVENAKALREKLGLESERPTVKIAILATGFGKIGKLHSSFEVVKDYGRKETLAMDQSDYGHRIAETYRSLLGPDSKIYLMNANGMTNLEDAFDYAIGRVDLIVSAHSAPKDLEKFQDLVKKAREKNVRWVNPKNDSEIMLPADNQNVTEVGNSK